MPEYYDGVLRRRRRRRLRHRFRITININLFPRINILVSLKRAMPGFGHLRSRAEGQSTRY